MTKQPRQTSHSVSLARGLHHPSPPLEISPPHRQIASFVENAPSSSRGNMSSSKYSYLLGFLTSSVYSSNECTNSKHVKTHSRDFSCRDPTCNQRFYRARDLGRHVSTRHRTKEEKNKYFCEFRDCKYATKGFSRNDNLLRHVRQKHGGGPRGSPRGALDLMQ